MYWRYILAILSIKAFDRRTTLPVSCLPARYICLISGGYGVDWPTLLRIVAMSVDLEVLLLSCSLALPVTNQLVLFLWPDMMRILLALLEARGRETSSFVLSGDQWHHVFALSISLHIVLEVSLFYSSLGKLNLLT